MVTEKAGCFLIKKETREIALIYRQKQEDYFDNQADDLYEQYVSDYYQKLEDEHKFVLIYNTSTIREYIIPGTNIHKTEQLVNGKVKTTSYFKTGVITKKEN